MTQTTSTFDATASAFNRHRAFPAGVPEAIRTAIGNCSPERAGRILDLGAGTGRIGKAFVQADDFYVGVDLSRAMLREFAADCPMACLLQADGLHLPFSDGSFDLVLLMQVLSGTENWVQLLSETMRVLSHPGSIVVGQTVTPASGVDAQLKRQLALILKEMDIAIHESKRSRQQALVWLEARSVRHQGVTAVRWKTQRTPEQFIARHRTGAHFAALPLDIQNQALERLSAWAKAIFGSLDKGLSEEHSFELDSFEMG